MNPMLWKKAIQVIGKPVASYIFYAVLSRHVVPFVEKKIKAEWEKRVKQ